ncbi:MAG: HdeD family acid-resistance protein [Armatimonadota bacterium]|nr:HdeD family acid-resistance protein [bacterium]
METVHEGGDWWFYVTLGVLMIALGILAIGVPFVTTLALAYVLGLIVLVSGIAVCIHAFKTRSVGGFVLKLVTGIVYIAAGIFLLAYPLAGTVALTLVLAIFWTVAGIVKIIRAISERHEPNWGWTLFNGIVTLILGLIVWSMWPTASLWVLGLFVGIDLIIAGWTVVALAFAARGGFFTPLYHPT